MQILAFAAEKMSPFSRDKAVTVAFGYKNIVR